MNKNAKKAFFALILVISLMLSACASPETVTPGQSVTPTETPINETAFYVAPNGNDENVGSKESPFATVERALGAVKATVAEGLTKPVTVYFREGDYKVSEIKLSEEMNGTAEFPVTFKAYKDENVAFNGGVSLNKDAFKPVSDEKIISRLNSEAKDKIFVADLKDCGLTREILGEIYPVGAEQAGTYMEQGAELKNTASVFWNEKRMTLARYPNEDYLYSDGLVDKGNQGKLIAGTTLVDADTALRMKSWQDMSEVRVFAYWMFMWAEMTSPIIKFDSDTRELQCLYYSTHGYKDSGSPYYFFNVLEELDIPGEYYIDRENMLLYFYFPDDTNGELLISLAESNMITGNVSNVTFEKIKMKGQRGGGFNLTGNNVKFLNCKFTCLDDTAVYITGTDNYIYGCEAYTLGQGGIYVYGGDRATLTPGNNVIENCYVHNYSEVYKTYRAALVVGDCGNKIIHNEIAYAPHVAMSYIGNEHLIAYNYVHDVVLESQDAGAVYMGGDWTSCGTKIMFNLFKNIGTGQSDCKAIYFDDGMSSGYVYGNIIDSCSGRAINIGGGRDMVVENNLVLSDVPFYYDCRVGTSTSPEVNWASLYWHVKPGEGLWTTLDRVPYLSDLWREKYPNLALITTDYSRYRDPEFPGNPAYSVIKNNIFVGRFAPEYEEQIDIDVFEYSEVGFNITTTKRTDYVDKNTYEVKEEKLEMYKLLNGFEWESIPYEEIGRYKTEE